MKTMEDTLMKGAGAAATAVSGKDATWKHVLIGGAPGILFDLGGMAYAYHAGHSSGSEPKEAEAEVVGTETVVSEEPVAAAETVTSETEVSPAATGQAASHAEILEAHSVNDGMSFGEAFAAARAEVGPGGAFVWHGRVYGTFRADDPEWQEMSAQERIELSNEICSQVHPAPYTPTSNEPEIIEDTTWNDIEEIHIYNVDEGVTVDGEDVIYAEGVADGHLAVLVDSNVDGVVDTLILDENDNQLGDSFEYHDISGEGITVNDLYMAAGEDPFGGQDYTNDADVNSLC